MNEAWFIAGMKKVTNDMWLKNWNERNGGNISLRLFENDLAPFRSELKPGRVLPIGEKIDGLNGQYFLVTASGSYFRNVQLAPEECLGITQVLEDNEHIRVLWGFVHDGIPTSEFSAHLRSHQMRQQVSAGRNRVVMHCHATNLIALSYILDLSSAVFTRALWEMSTECLVVFPDGVGVLPWMAPGTPQIGKATAEAMAKHPLALWPFHGVFGTGSSLDETLGLIDTAEKAATILVKVLAMGGPRHSITTENLTTLAQRFHVQPMQEAIECASWLPAGKF
jgi:rhamnulose-1-phosphate aldolase